MYNKLVKNYENIADNRVTLFCLPFAGGGASAYNGWIKKMQETITVCPIQLPGREERIMDKPYSDMNSLLDDLVGIISNFANTPYALWGHSMGGKIAYELEKRLENGGYIAKYFIVSGSRVPHIPEPNPIYHLSDTEFKTELERFEGTPKEVLKNDDLLNFFLPMLRADFTMDETYCVKEPVPLKCPIIAFGGTEDKEAKEEDVKAWNSYTVNGFRHQMFPGGHFYIKDQEVELIDAIIKVNRCFSHNDN